VFFLFVFLENYLWIFPYFKNDLISDLTLQWKVNGSIVGAVNQLLYGFSLYLMTKISGNSEMAHKKIAFALYFLGLFNLMFNWGHHIYLVPTSRFIHHLSYIVSMTEWIIFIKIILDWKKQLSESKKYYYFFPYRFIMASEYWVAINLFLALLLSIPAVNLFTHGTHITVAHAMGTTIGINMMIILAGAFYYIAPPLLNKLTRITLNTLFWLVQSLLFLFIFVLVIMGVKKSIWQFSDSSITFSQHQDSLSFTLVVFIVLGALLFFSLAGILLFLMQQSFIKKSKS
jgi:nitric oxide reductase subunit B